MMGAATAEADAELILLTNSLLKNVGLRNYAFKLGHMGVIRSILTEEGVDEKTQNGVLQLMDKKEYDEAFKLVKQERCRKILQGLLEQKGETSFETLENMKIYVRGYEKAEAAVDNLLDILVLVTQSDCPVETVEPAFARGLEYYTGVIFEVYIPELDIALGGGGRYDRLIELFGGEQTPATGVAHGLDRIAMAMQMQGVPVKAVEGKRLVVVSVNELMRSEALRIAERLRNAGLGVEFEVMGRKMSKALEDADKRHLDYAVIVGERELKEGKVVVRDLHKREQTTVDLEKLADKIRGGT
jgi:histidyl-tRNA synthetase